MFIRGGMPVKTLFLIRTVETARNQEYVAGGFGYLLDLSVATNFALLVYVLAHPEESLLSRNFVSIIFCCLICNSICGSRLVFGSAVLSVLVLLWIIPTALITDL